MRLTCLAPLAVLAIPVPAAAADPVDYRKDVRPVLQERCYACHGALKQNAKLRVDSGAGMIRAGVVMPGKLDASELIGRDSSADGDYLIAKHEHQLKQEKM